MQMYLFACYGTCPILRELGWHQGHINMIVARLMPQNAICAKMYTKQLPKCILNNFPKWFIGHVTHCMTRNGFQSGLFRPCNFFIAGLTLAKLNYIKFKILGILSGQETHCTILTSSWEQFFSPVVFGVRMEIRPEFICVVLCECSFQAESAATFVVWP